MDVVDPDLFRVTCSRCHDEVTGDSIDTCTAPDCPVRSMWLDETPGFLTRDPSEGYYDEQPTHWYDNLILPTAVAISAVTACAIAYSMFSLASWAIRRL